jgi:hypothetical protein
LPVSFPWEIAEAGFQAKGLNVAGGEQAWAALWAGWSVVDVHDAQETAVPSEAGRASLAAHLARCPCRRAWAGLVDDDNIAAAPAFACSQ